MELQVGSHGNHRDGQLVVHLRWAEMGVLEPGRCMDFIGDCASLSSLGHSDPPDSWRTSGEPAGKEGDLLSLLDYSLSEVPLRCLWGMKEGGAEQPELLAVSSSWQQG